MPSRPGPKISDYVSQLGIRDMFPPQRRVYHEACPQIDKLKEEIKVIAGTHYNLHTEEIRNSTAIRNAVALLLKKYGASIWSDQTHRPWLFDPGQGAVTARYVKDLYYSNRNDKKFGPADYCLSQTPDTAPTASYSPSAKARITSGVGNHAPNLRCFASIHGHLDGEGLDRLGVWLGDADDYDRPVNGISKREVEKNFYEHTTGGLDCGKAEPHVLLTVLNIATEETVVCGSCRDDPTSPPLRLQTMRFEWTKDDDPDLDVADEMRLHAWTYRCRFKGSEVFAFVEEVPERQCRNLGFNNRIWSFWRIDGGYTARVLLVEAKGHNAFFPILTSDLHIPAFANGKRKRVGLTTGTIDDGDPCPSTRLVRRQMTNAAPSEDQQRQKMHSGLLGTGQNSLSTFQAMNASSSASIPGPGDSAGKEAIPARVRRPSFNSLYDVTPRPKWNNQSHGISQSAFPPSREPSEAAAGAAKQATGLVSLIVSEKQHDASNASNPTAADARGMSSSASRSGSTSFAEPCHMERDMIPHSNTAASEKDTAIPPLSCDVLQFKIWFPFKIAGTADLAEKAVRYKTSMSFEDAFVHTTAKLGRQLGNRELLGLTVDSKIDGKPSLLVDEPDMWEELLAMVKQTCSDELKGTVDME